MTNPHLDDDVIAAVVDGGDTNARLDAITHLNECAECRDRLAAVAKLMDDSVVAREIELVAPAKVFPLRRWTPPRWAAVTMVAAAAGLAIVLLTPTRSGIQRLQNVPSEVRREGTLTTTAPPQILSPRGFAGSNDSLRWTTVVGADLYRVQIWNRDGTIVWSTETRTTSVPVPSQLIAAGGSYLWEVKARTGWDRWVASDFLEFTIRNGSR
jgi:hypothetical protein